MSNELQNGRLILDTHKNVQISGNFPTVSIVCTNEDILVEWVSFLMYTRSKNLPGEVFTVDITNVKNMDEVHKKVVSQYEQRWKETEE